PAFLAGLVCAIPAPTQCLAIGGGNGRTRGVRDGAARETGRRDAGRADGHEGRRLLAGLGAGGLCPPRMTARSVGSGPPVPRSAAHLRRWRMRAGVSTRGFCTRGALVSLLV